MKLTDHQDSQEPVETSNTYEYVETSDAKYYLNVPYWSYRLNQLDICVPKKLPENPDKAVWLIYIHGGAWRDPVIDRKSFNSTLDMLLKDNLPHNIAGFVSLDYRLSSYPSHPTNPSDPNDPSRNVKHPDHIGDVTRALVYLNKIEPKHTTSDGRTIQVSHVPHTDLMRQGRYVLCGHSCGATLALQAVGSTIAHEHLLPPMAVIGIEGIYDMPGLLARNTHAVYREIVAGAFTEDSAIWNSASPTNLEFAGWNGRVLLIHSDKDELVEMQQMDSMVESFVASGFTKSTSATEEKTVEQRIIHCSHDEVWEKGVELAKAIRWVSQLS